jgi:hypothetical protein
MKKRIPVKGYMIHAEDGDSSHSHKLFITSWDGRPVHVHPFEGITSFDVGHDHHYAGITQPAPNGVPHVHGYCAITSFNDGHDHIIKGITGPVIPVPGDGHIHHFEGYTTINGRTPHAHLYRGTTGNEA